VKILRLPSTKKNQNSIKNQEEKPEYIPCANIDDTFAFSKGWVDENKNSQANCEKADNPPENVHWLYMPPLFKQAVLIKKS
jgi:hypothetical protein